MTDPYQDPLASILAEAELNRRIDRAAAAQATTTAAAAQGDGYTVGTPGVPAAPGNAVVLDANGKIPAGYMYPANAGTIARTYTHVQSVAADTWRITHGLGGYPPVVVVDEDDVQMLGEVSYPDGEHVVIRFGHPESGTAHMSL